MPDRLRRCVRDLAALTALPSLCIGRSPEEALDIVIDALPTALACDLVYLQLPGTPPLERSWVRGAPGTPALVEEIRWIATGDNDGADPAVFVAGERIWCLEADVPMGT